MDSSAPHAFDAARENLGMVVVGLIILVVWLLFRRLLKSSETAPKDKLKQ